MSGLAVALCLAAPGCTRLNPAFEGGKDASGGADSAENSTSASATSDAESFGSVGGTADAVSSGTSPGGGGSTTGSHVCGNGVRDPGEGCDDGNLEWGDGCDERCQREPLLDWVHDSAFEDGIAERFNDVVLVRGVVVAAGRGENPSSGDQEVRLVSLDAGNGELLDDWGADVGMGSGGEARGVGARGPEVYYAGRSNEPGVEAVFGRTALGNDGTFGPATVLDIPGTRAKGITFQGEDVVVTTGSFNQDGPGLATCTATRGCTGWVSSEPGGQLDAVLAHAGGLFAAGLRDGTPHLFEVTDPTVVEGLSELFAQGRPGRFQSLAAEGDMLYAAGSIRDAGDEDAWVVAFSLSSGVIEWEAQIDGGSPVDDEFEDLVVTEDGSVVVVGMLGEPPLPAVFEYGPDGAPRWEHSFEPIPGAASGHARGVAAEADEIYLAGEWRRTYSAGDASGGTGVGFVAKLVR